MASFAADEAIEGETDSSMIDEDGADGEVDAETSSSSDTEESSSSTTDGPREPQVDESLAELVADQSIGDLYALKLRLRDQKRRRAGASSEPYLTPSVRIDGISNEGKVVVKFQTPMNFPANFTDIINE